MRLRWGLVAAAAGGAIMAHLAAAFLVRGMPIAGAGAFGREVSAIVGDPPPADGDYPPPMRVSLGVAEHAPARAPGPRPVLDPAPVRRKPEVSAEWHDSGARTAAYALALSPGPAEAREAVSTRPPGTGPVLDARARGPSSADRSVSREAVALAVKASTRALPGRFRPAGEASLAGAAKALRPSLAAGEVRLEFPRALVAPEPPADWSAPEGAIAAPDVFVDVTLAGE